VLHLFAPLGVVWYLTLAGDAPEARDFPGPARIGRLARTAPMSVARRVAGFEFAVIFVSC
jgi:hypothetical protein